MKVLQLCLRIPYAASDGGSIAMLRMQEALLQSGVQLKVLAFNTHKHYIDPDSIDAGYRSRTGLEEIYLDNRVKPLTALLNLFSVDSYNVIRFIRRDFDEALTRILLEQNYDVVLLESLFMAPYIGTIRRHSGAKVILRAHNVEHLIWQRLAEQEGNTLRRWYLRLLARRLKVFERAVFNSVDAVVTVSPEDKELIRKFSPMKPVHVSPIGLNADDYRPFHQADTSAVFHLGAMDWLPNQEGVEWLLDKVWPIVLQSCPRATLHLAGKRMPESILRRASVGLQVEEFVKDAREYMSRYGIMVVPLLSGGGMRVKIVEGMLMQKAIVSTSIGAEGIPVSGESEILLADTPDSFASAIVRLIRDRELQLRLGSNAREFASANFDNRKIGEELIRFFSRPSPPNPVGVA